MIIAERLAQLSSLSLAHGAHRSFEEGACAMEMASWLAGEPWSDHPACASQVIGAFMRAWNDGLPQEERDALILPLIPRLVGTRGSEALEKRRATMAADWLVRVHTPAWLRLAGLTAQADALSGLPEITDFANTQSLRGPLEAARKDGAAAWDAAWDAAGAAAWAAAGAAAWDAAWDAAGAAAWAAARDAARDAAGAAAWAAARDAAWDAARAAAGAAAWDAAWDAARDAAWAAARDAAWDAAGAAARAAARAAAWDAARADAKAKLEPTRRELQQSALALVIRMIEATET